MLFRSPRFGVRMASLTYDIEHEADEAMVRSEWEQHPIDQYNVFKIVDDALSVEKVHSRAEKVPVQGLGESQAASSRGDI